MSFVVGLISTHCESLQCLLVPWHCPNSMVRIQGLSQAKACTGNGMVIGLDSISVDAKQCLFSVFQ